MSACANPRTYFVISPEIELYPGDRWGLYGNPEPPEDGCAVMEVQASSKREAIAYAIRHPNREFDKWVDVARGDGRTPFSGVRAEHVHCCHDVCPDLFTTDVGCDECAREDREEQERIARGEVVA